MVGQLADLSVCERVLHASRKIPVLDSRQAFSLVYTRQQVFSSMLRVMWVF